MLTHIDDILGLNNLHYLTQVRVTKSVNKIKIILVSFVIRFNQFHIKD